jgi:energy-coupling factor transport system permease protein
VSPIVVPLVSNALLRSTVLGLTIDMRGYRTGTRTRVRERRLNYGDYLMIVILAVTSVVFAVVTFIAPGLIY